MFSCSLCDYEGETTRALRIHYTMAHGPSSANPQDGAGPSVEGSSVEGTVSDFVAPQARSSSGSTKTKRKPAAKRAPASQPQAIAVNEQIAMLYSLVGDFANARGLPATGAVVKQNSAPIGVAWDQFLQQFPGLYEMIQRGMVFGPAVTLIMLHVPIFQTARAEAERIAAYRAQMEGGGGEQAAA